MTQPFRLTFLERRVRTALNNLMGSLPAKYSRNKNVLAEDNFHLRARQIVASTSAFLNAAFLAAAGKIPKLLRGGHILLYPRIPCH